MARPRRPWFRFYTEAVHDPKIRSLTPHERWLWVCVLAAARMSPRPGTLLISDTSPHQVRSISELAGVDMRVTKRGINAFTSLGMIDTDENGYWLVRNWNERQYESDDVTERTRKHRSREQDRNVPKMFPGTPPETETENRTFSSSVVYSQPPKTGFEEDEESLIEKLTTIARARMAQLPQQPNFPNAWLQVAIANLAREHRAGTLNLRTDPNQAMRRDYDHQRTQCATCDSTGWTYHDGNATRCDKCA